MQAVDEQPGSFGQLPAALRCVLVATAASLLATSLGCVHAPAPTEPAAAAAASPAKRSAHQQLRAELLARLAVVQRLLFASPRTATQRKQHEELLARRLWIIVALQRLELGPALSDGADVEALLRVARTRARRLMADSTRGGGEGRRHKGEEGKMGGRDVPTGATESYKKAAEDNGRLAAGLAERCDSSRGPCQEVMPPVIESPPVVVNKPPSSDKDESGESAPAAARVAQSAPRAQVMQAVSGHLGQLSACLPAQLRGQQMVVTVRTRVDAGGVFRSPSVAADGLDTQVQSCLLTVLRAVRVPDNQGESVVSFALYLGEP